MINALLVDDEPMFFDLLKISRQSVCNFLFIQEPANLFDFLEHNPVDIILMDWNLGGKSGLDYVKEIRSNPTFCSLPIIMLTAKSDKSHVIEGLNFGADDYITKQSFDIDVLIARIQAHLSKKQLQVPVKLLPQTFEILIDNKRIKLRRKEFLIFKTLLEHPETTFTREYLNGLTSGSDVFVSGRSIDTFVRFLRQKLPYPELIQTVRGKGYCFNLSVLEMTVKSES